jgi:hypothetical protein
MHGVQRKEKRENRKESEEAHFSPSKILPSSSLFSFLISLFFLLPGGAGHSVIADGVA